MKIMSKLSFLPLLLLGFVTQAQTERVGSEPKKLPQLYFSFGQGIAFSTSDLVTSTGTDAKLNITTTYPSNNIFRAGFSISSFEDDQPATKAFKADYPNRNSSPYHTLVTPYLAFGKRKLINRFFQVHVMGGLSFSWHHGAENVFRYTILNGIAGYKENLDYEMTDRFVPGLVIQAEAMALPLRFAGLSLGGYYNFIPKISHAGLTFSLNLGRIRSKEIL